MMNEKLEQVRELERQNRAEAAQIDQHVAHSGILIDEHDAVRRRWLCGFVDAFRSAFTRTSSPPSSAPSAIFGTGHGRSDRVGAATQRLNQASESVAVHASQLAERAATAHARVRSLLAEGKRHDALLALKRAKQLEKQADAACETQVALETHVDVLESSAIQKVVASALSASVNATKSRTKRLLSNTEAAVDDVSELRDLQDDVAQALGGLQSDTVCDDELLAELDAMTTTSDFREMKLRPVVEAHAERDFASFPSAPTKRYERLTEIGAV